MFTRHFGVFRVVKLTVDGVRLVVMMAVAGVIGVELAVLGGVWVWRGQVFGGVMAMGVGAVMVVYAAGVPFRAKYHARREIRREYVLRGCCPKCGYNLRGTPEQCPECGYVTPLGRKRRREAR